MNHHNLYLMQQGRDFFGNPLLPNYSPHDTICYWIFPDVHLHDVQRLAGTRNRHWHWFGLLAFFVEQIHERKQRLLQLKSAASAWTLFTLKRFDYSIIIKKVYKIQINEKNTLFS